MYTGKSIKKVQKGCTYIVASTKEELKEGSKIPVPADGDQYVTEDYKYTYFQIIVSSTSKFFKIMSMKFYQLCVVQLTRK